MPVQSAHQIKQQNNCRNKLQNYSKQIRQQYLNTKCMSIRLQLLKSNYLQINDISIGNDYSLPQILIQNINPNDQIHFVSKVLKILASWKKINISQLNNKYSYQIQSFFNSFKDKITGIIILMMQLDIEIRQIKQNKQISQIRQLRQCTNDVIKIHRQDKACRQYITLQQSNLNFLAKQNQNVKVATKMFSILKQLAWIVFYQKMQALFQLSQYKIYDSFYLGQYKIQDSFELGQQKVQDPFQLRQQKICFKQLYKKIMSTTLLKWSFYYEQNMKLFYLFQKRDYCQNLRQNKKYEQSYEFNLQYHIQYLMNIVQMLPIQTLLDIFLINPAQIPYLINQTNDIFYKQFSFLDICLVQYLIGYKEGLKFLKSVLIIINQKLIEQEKQLIKFKLIYCGQSLLTDNYILQRQDTLQNFQKRCSYFQNRIYQKQLENQRQHFQNLNIS